MKKSIYAHCLVQNEERFLWYSISSVIEFIDKVLIWDAGSTDNTIKIVNLLKNKYPGKIIFREYGEVSTDTFYKARQDMLNETGSDWFLVLDGDEVWWNKSIKKVYDFINEKGDKYESIVVPTYNLVGDIFHFQEDRAGRYKFGKRKGHFNLRAVKRSIPGLKSLGKHGLWGWVDEKNNMIQNRDNKKIKYLDAPYLHASFLQRGGSVKDDKLVTKRSKKFKYEFGNKFPLDFYYPEVFFKERPVVVPSVWDTPEFNFKFRAFFETPLRKVKRKIFYGKTGY